MIHLRGPMSALRLVSAAGLPPALTRAWEIIDQEGPLAPARALHQGSGVWAPRELTAHSVAGEAAWPGSGLAAAPLSGGDRSIGALSVVMGEGGEPTPEQWDFLRAVIAWTEERMAQAPPPSGPVQTEFSGERLRQALKEVSVGSWDWDIRTGDLHLGRGGPRALRHQTGRLHRQDRELDEDRPPRRPRPDTGRRAAGDPRPHGVRGGVPRTRPGRYVRLDPGPRQGDVRRTRRTPPDDRRGLGEQRVPVRP